MLAATTTLLSDVLTPEDIVRGVTHLPSAPKVLPRLKRLLGDANSSMGEVVALIRLDPGISARVLRVGNSIYYSKGVRCHTVDEAVNRVGYDQVYELVSYAVASQVLVRPLAVYAIEADEMWRRAVACALAAETLAARTGQDRDIAYTAGLLHALGMVAIDEWALRWRPGLVLADGGLPREATEGERAALGFTQADVGAALLRHWDFPRSMTEPVRWQYAPRASASAARMAGLLHCAKWLRTVVCAAAGEPPPPPPAEAVLQLVPLRAAELPGLARTVGARLQEISSLLEVEAAGHETVRPHFPAQAWMVAVD
jgi:HD-like signal output (HDOD) protein